MAEHFNIALALGNRISPERRAEVFSTLITIYAPFFDKLHEVCLHNYQAGTSRCEDWPSGEGLLKADIAKNELLFLYGVNSDGAPGARSSIHFDESDLGVTFLVSLPISTNSGFFSNQLVQCLSATQKLAESLLVNFIVAAGWELECDMSQKIESVLDDYFSELSLSLWIAAPKHLISSWPKAYIKVSESDKAILLRNVGGL